MFNQPVCDLTFESEIKFDCAQMLQATGTHTNTHRHLYTQTYGNFGGKDSSLGSPRFGLTWFGSACSQIRLQPHLHVQIQVRHTHHYTHMDKHSRVCACSLGKLNI